MNRKDPKCPTTVLFRCL